jgi:hypothetical protein
MVWRQMLEAVDHIHKHRIVHGKYLLLTMFFFVYIFLMTFYYDHHNNDCSCNH